MRNRFDTQLNELKEQLFMMGALCENAIALAAKAVSEGEGKLFDDAAKISEKIDAAERDIEGLCLKLLLTQHPVATDLRTVSLALKIITDMERIGNQSADIAEIVATAKIKAPKNLPHIRAIAEIAIKMVTDSVEAFVNNDVALALETIDRDDEADACFIEIKQELLEVMKSDRADTYRTLDLMIIAKHFERIADHAVNIAKRVAFI